MLEASLTDGQLKTTDEAVNITQVVDELRVSEREEADVTVCLSGRHQLYQRYIHTCTHV